MSYLEEFLATVIFGALLIVGLFWDFWTTIILLAFGLTVFFVAAWNVAKEQTAQYSVTPEAQRLKETYDMERSHLDTHMNAPFWKSMPDPMARAMMSPDPAARSALGIPDRLMVDMSPPRVERPAKPQPEARPRPETRFSARARFSVS